MNTRLTGFLSSVGCLLLLIPLSNGGQRDSETFKGTVRADDGLSIVYEARGEGETGLVFLHGWCGDRTWWTHQLDEFTDDYRVVAIDQAGHGESGKNREEWSALGLAEDVQAVVTQLGLKRVILVGHSMGGPVALAAAKRMPGTVVAVVGVDTLHNAEYQWPEEQWKTVLNDLEEDFKGTIREALRGMLPDDVDPQLRESITTKVESQDPRMAVALFRDITRLDTKALLRDAKVPVRCINSAPSTPFAIPTADDINRKYADFHAVIMEGVGHFPMLEKPGEFNEHLRDVLKEFAPEK